MESPSHEPSLSPMHSLDCVTIKSPQSYPERVHFPQNVQAAGKVATLDSVLSTSYLYEVGRKFNFPPSTILDQPREGDRACFPPTAFVTIYEDHLVSSLRVPFPAIYAEIYEMFGVSPVQIYPNGVLQIIGLGIACKRLGLSFLAKTFGAMYSYI